MFDYDEQYNRYQPNPRLQELLDRPTLWNRIVSTIGCFLMVFVFLIGICSLVYLLVRPVQAQTLSNQVCGLYMIDASPDAPRAAVESPRILAENILSQCRIGSVVIIQATGEFGNVSRIVPIFCNYQYQISSERINSNTVEISCILHAPRIWN